MMVAPRSRAAWLSNIGFFGGGVLIIVCIAKTISSASDRYWPLLAIGFLMVCISAAPYYYLRNRELDHEERLDAGMQALNAAAKNLQKKKK